MSACHILTLTWGFRRCSFRLAGQCEGLYTVERVTILAPRFFCVPLKNAIRMPDGERFTTSMPQNVYMASFAHLIPLLKTRRRYRKHCVNPQFFGVPLALYPLAECWCWDLPEWCDVNLMSTKTFHFKWLYDGVHSNTRDIKMTPRIVELKLKGKYKRQNFLVLTIANDNVFANKDVYSYSEFSTVFSIVSLKKAVYNSKFNAKVKWHLARYPTGFQLWLFLDNHNLNRFLFEFGGDKCLFREGVDFTMRQEMPWLKYYGAEKEFTNKKTIFDDTPHTAESVRMCLIK